MSSITNTTTQPINDAPRAALTILRRPQVQSATGLSCAAIYAAMSRGEFPRPVRLTAKAVGWRSTDVSAWIESRQS